jgi:hypothetical protein
MRGRPPGHLPGMPPDGAEIHGIGELWWRKKHHRSRYSHSLPGSINMRI